jgi:serine/threonine-protein kinase
VYDTTTGDVDATANGHHPPPSRWPWVAGLLALLAVAVVIAIFLATRPTKVLVPNVAGESIGVAQAHLNTVGLNTDIQQRMDPSKPGTVIVQFPSAGIKVDQNSTVTLTVSTGPGNVNVPAVAGLSEDAALQKLRAAGLVPSGVQKTNSSTVPSGQVIGTTPSQSVSVGAGSAITLIISLGKPEVPVPFVTGDSESAAKSTIGAAGFTATTSTQPSSTVPVGQVISQDPAGGTKAAAGAPVGLVVSNGPSTAIVPTVIGDTAASAVAQIQSAGFQVSRTHKKVAKQSNDGIVMAESPSSGEATKGSTIAIVVGVYKAPTRTTPTNTTPTTTTTSTTPTSTTPTTTTTSTTPTTPTTTT